MIAVDSLQKTLGDLKEIIGSYFGWPLDQFRLLARGKTDSELTLEECKIKPPVAKIVITFSKTFFDQNKGSSFLERAEIALKAVEEEVEEIKQRLAQRLLAREDLNFELLHCREKLLDVRGPLQESQVKAVDSERKIKLQERVAAVERALEEFKN